MLAGISPDYYLRLEQGRDRNPSVQVLGALVAALRLDDVAAAHLRELAAGASLRRSRRTRRESVPSSIVELVDSLPFPAFVEGRTLDVLAANRLAAALSPRITVGENRLRAVFLDPFERHLYVRWEDATAGIVASFRRSIGTDVADARVVELVGELSLVSDRFRALWARHDLQSFAGATTEFDHPLVGRLRLHREKLALDGGSGGLVLALYHPGSGARDAEQLALLASLSLPPRTEASGGEPAPDRPDDLEPAGG